MPPTNETDVIIRSASPESGFDIIVDAVANEFYGACTSNHQVQTDDGFKCVGELKVGDHIHGIGNNEYGNMSKFNIVDVVGYVPKTQ